MARATEYGNIYSKIYTVKPVLSGYSKKTKIGFQDQLSLNAGQKYCREPSAILSTFIKLPFVLKTFVSSVFLSGRFRQVLLYMDATYPLLANIYYEISVTLLPITFLK